MARNFILKENTIKLEEKLIQTMRIRLPYRGELSQHKRENFIGVPAKQT